LLGPPCPPKKKKANGISMLCACQNTRLSFFVHKNAHTSLFKEATTTLRLLYIFYRCAKKGHQMTVKLQNFTSIAVYFAILAPPPPQAHLIYAGCAANLVLHHTFYAYAIF